MKQEITNKRQKWSKGALVQVPLGGESYCYAQMLSAPEYAFFDSRDLIDPTPKEIISQAVIFRLWVMRYAHSKGRWLKCGKASVPDFLQSEVARYKQDAITGELSLYLDCQEEPATVEDCKGLECAAVWDPEHVEERIRDFYQGRKNIWVESMAIRDHR